MRLIDVDAFKNDYHMADECKDCQTPVRTCEYDRVYTKMDFCEWLDSASTVQPEQRWIPCSERLPEKEVVYIITVHYDDRNFITFDNFCSYKHGWKEWSNQEVLAWMPLPEAYREE